MWPLKSLEPPKFRMVQPPSAAEVRVGRAASAIAALIGVATLVADLWAARTRGAAPEWDRLALSAGIIALALANLLGGRGRAAAMLTLVGVACALAAWGLPLAR